MRYRKSYIVVLAAISMLGVAAVSYSLWHYSRTASVVTAKICSPCAHTVILSHEDFGPPVMAYDLGIGHAWNQWKGEGHELPDDVDIKVVVYRGVALDEVKKQFPVVRGTSDYRYLDYARAVQFLEQQDKEVESYRKEAQDRGDSDGVKMWDDLGRTLKKTHKLIIENLGV